MKNTKKILSVLLSLMMIISIIPMSSITASADAPNYAEIGDFLVTLNNTDMTCHISEYLGSDKSIIVPSLINGYVVSGINYEAFSGHIELVEIELPDTITYIGGGAFYNTGYYNEQSNWSDGVLYIGEYLIRADEDLVKNTYNIKEDTKLIASRAFSSCINLTSITIPESVTIICDDAFAGCNNLEEINMSSNVVDMGDAFEDTAYYNTESNWENGILYIGNWLYTADCSKISDKVTVKDGTKHIKGYSFSDVYEGDSSADTLVEVVLPNSIITIGNNAFAGCDGLTNIILPDSVETVGNRAFFSCEKLSVVIGSKVAEIGTCAFSGCNEVYVDDANSYYSNDAFGVLFNKEKTKLIQYPGGNTRETYIIPNTVIEIGENAFYYSENLVNINIPETVKAIRDYAFYYCLNLNKIYYTGTADYWVQIEFSFNSGNPMEWADTVYFNNELVKDIVISNDVTKINENSFKCCKTLESVVIGNNVILIGDSSFEDCSSLTRISISNSVMVIGDDAFNGCGSLTSITIPNNVTTIGDYAFCNCYSLTNAIIGSGVTTIGHSAFFLCNNLTNLAVDNENEIYSSDEYGVLFNKDKTLLIQYPVGNTRTSYTISDSVTTINDWSFNDCTSLEKIIIPESVTLIGSYTFNDCNNLTDVYYSGTEKEWNNISIGESNDSLLNAIIWYLDEEIHECSYEPIVTPSTCTEQGYTTYSCSCGDSYVSDYVDVTGHTSKKITIDATCTVTGMKYDVCEICGETLGDSTVLPATGHTVGEWEVVLEPTYEADGKKVKKCTICGEVVEEKIIPKLVKNVVIDEDTGVSMEFDSNNYNGEVEIVVEESFDGIAFDIVDTSLNASQKFIYDITMTVDGVATQPNGKVTIKIPLPDGYDSNCSFVYYVNTETGTVEKMPASYEDGYMVFETTHFSYYAIIEEYNYTFSIQEPSRTEIRNKDGIVLHANVEGTAPAGSYIVWTSSNGNFDEDADGNSLTVIAEDKGYTTFTATLYDADKNVLATDSVELYSKSGFFDKIGGFFRSLFGSTKIYEN